MDLKDNELYNVSGGNAITDLGRTIWGKMGLALCRNDVKEALTDEEFTNKLLTAKKSEIKDLFKDRGVSVSDSEVEFCYDKILNKLKK